MTFDELRDIAMDLTQNGVRKAKVYGEIAKLNISVITEEENIRKAYVEIGSDYYDKHNKSADNAYAVQCAKVDLAKAKIAEYKDKIVELKEDNAQ
jgi:hypothetical protein